jgi:hypothetical protein
LITLAAYLTATMLIALAALVGIFRYSTSSRLATLPPITTESAPGLAVAHLDRVHKSDTIGTATSSVEVQRIRVLESMLEEKTQRLRQQSEQLKAKTAEYEDLRARYDETVLLAVDSLEHRVDAKAVAEQPADEEVAAAATDPAVLEAELTAAGVVHESLVADLASLQEELARAYSNMAQLKEAKDQETSERLREAQILEAAAANVLLRVGRESVPALRDALSHASPAVRRWAATVLGGIGPDAEEAVPALTETLSDRDPGVREAARSALEAIER